MDAHAEYSRRLDARRLSLAATDARHRQFGTARAILFVIALLLLVPVVGGPVRAWWLLLPIAPIVALDRPMRRLEVRRAALARAVALYERGLARLDDRWVGQGENGSRFLDERHPYAHDLDVFGEASLFELLGAGRTRIGEATLAQWLLAPAPPKVVLTRQEAVRDLAPRLDLSEAVGVASDHARAGVDDGTLTAWAEASAVFTPSPWRVAAQLLSVLGAFALAAIAIYVLSLLRVVVVPAETAARLLAYFLAVTAACLTVVSRVRKRTERVIGAVSRSAGGLVLLSEILERIEAEPFSAPRLRELQASLTAGGAVPSRAIARLNRLAALIDARRNPIMQFAGPLLLWDLHVSYAVEDWRRTHGHAVRRWLAIVGETEALSALAALHYERPDYAFPELVEGPPRFDAERLGHPLIPAHRRVANDVQLGGDLRLLVVSGSNMSGKSTLLRTVGVNAALAQAGAPVCARRLRLTPLAIGASIRIVDSLQQGSSRFYAEISRIRQIVGLTTGPPPVLFLIDEVLHGTNSHDRRIGARAIVTSLVERGAIGLVTTHDLALTDVASDSRGANVHFDDHLEHGRLSFDYQLRPGVVTKSNALALMRSIGLDV